MPENRNNNTDAEAVIEFFIGTGLYLLQATQSTHRAKVFDEELHRIRPEYAGLREFYRGRTPPEAVARPLYQYLATGKYAIHSKGMFAPIKLSREEIFWAVRSLYDLSHVLGGHDPTQDDFLNLEGCLRLSYSRFEERIRRLRKLRKQTHGTLNHYNRDEHGAKPKEIGFWVRDDWHLWMSSGHL